MALVCCVCVASQLWHSAYPLGTTGLTTYASGSSFPNSWKSLFLVPTLALSSRKPDSGSAGGGPSWILQH